MLINAFACRIDERLDALGVAEEEMARRADGVAGVVLPDARYLRQGLELAPVGAATKSGALPGCEVAGYTLRDTRATPSVMDIRAPSSLSPFVVATASKP